MLTQEQQKQINEEMRRKLHSRGLGDTVASVAQVGAKVIDAVLRTNLKNCPKCKRRQQVLNEKFPYKDTQ